MDKITRGSFVGKVHSVGYRVAPDVSTQHRNGRGTHVSTQSFKLDNPPLPPRVKASSGIQSQRGSAKDWFRHDAHNYHTITAPGDKDTVAHKVTECWNGNQDRDHARFERFSPRFWRNSAGNGPSVRPEPTQYVERNNTNEKDTQHAHNIDRPTSKERNNIHADIPISITRNYNTKAYSTSGDPKNPHLNHVGITNPIRRSAGIRSSGQIQTSPSSTSKGYKANVNKLYETTQKKNNAHDDHPLGYTTIGHGKAPTYTDIPQKGYSETGTGNRFVERSWLLKHGQKGKKAMDLEPPTAPKSEDYIYNKIVNQKQNSALAYVKDFAPPARAKHMAAVREGIELDTNPSEAIVDPQNKPFADKTSPGSFGDFYDPYDDTHPDANPRTKAIKAKNALHPDIKKEVDQAHRELVSGVSCERKQHKRLNYTNASPTYWKSENWMSYSTPGPQEQKSIHEIIIEKFSSPRGKRHAYAAQDMNLKAGYGSPGAFPGANPALQLVDVKYEQGQMQQGSARHEQQGQMQRKPNQPLREDQQDMSAAFASQVNEMKQHYLTDHQLGHEEGGYLEFREQQSGVDFRQEQEKEERARQGYKSKVRDQQYHEQAYRGGEAFGDAGVPANINTADNCGHNIVGSSAHDDSGVNPSSGITAPEFGPDHYTYGCRTGYSDLGITAQMSGIPPHLIPHLRAVPKGGDEFEKGKGVRITNSPAKEEKISQAFVGEESTTRDNGRTLVQERTSLVEGKKCLFGSHEHSKIADHVNMKQTMEQKMARLSQGKPSQIRDQSRLQGRPNLNDDDPNIAQEFRTRQQQSSSEQYRKEKKAYRARTSNQKKEDLKSRHMATMNSSELTHAMDHTQAQILKPEAEFIFDKTTVSTTYGKRKSGACKHPAGGANLALREYDGVVQKKAIANSRNPESGFPDNAIMRPERNSDFFANDVNGMGILGDNTAKAQGCYNPARPVILPKYGAKQD